MWLIHTRKTCEKVALFKKKGEYHYTGLFLELSLTREGLECTLNYSDYFLTGSGNAWQSSVPNGRSASNSLSGYVLWL